MDNKDTQPGLAGPQGPEIVELELQAKLATKDSKAVSKAQQQQLGSRRDSSKAVFTLLGIRAESESALESQAKRTVSNEVEDFIVNEKDLGRVVRRATADDVVEAPPYGKPHTPFVTLGTVATTPSGEGMFINVSPEPLKEHLGI